MMEAKTFAGILIRREKSVEPTRFGSFACALIRDILVAEETTHEEDHHCRSRSAADKCRRVPRATARHHSRNDRAVAAARRRAARGAWTIQGHVRRRVRLARLSCLSPG